MFGWRLPPGVTEAMIPGNSDKDIFAERVVDALERKLDRAIRRGDVPPETTIDDLWEYLELAEDLLAGEHVTPDEIAEEALVQYMNRPESEDDEYDQEGGEAA